MLKVKVRITRLIPRSVVREDRKHGYEYVMTFDSEIWMGGGGRKRGEVLLYIFDQNCMF